MQVTKEDRIFKSVALLSIFVGLFVGFSNLDSEYILGYSVLMMIILIVLGVRKYLRAKKAGSPLTAYYMALGFMLLTALLAFYALYIVS